MFNMEGSFDKIKFNIKIIFVMIMGFDKKAHSLIKALVIL